MVVREVRPDDPAVVPIIAIHVATMSDGNTPSDACHRPDLAGLLDPTITFFGAYPKAIDHTINHSVHHTIDHPVHHIVDETLHASSDASIAPDGPVGIGAFAHRAADWGEVKSMHVLEPRDRSISRALLEAIEGEDRARGVGTLRLETARHFTAAISLYERSGFAECGALGDYNDHPASLFMEKRLS